MGVKLDRLRQNCFSFPPLNFPAIFFSSGSAQNSDLIGLTVLARQHTNTEAVGLLYYPIAEHRAFLFRNETFKV